MAAKDAIVAAERGPCSAQLGPKGADGPARWCPVICLTRSSKGCCKTSPCLTWSSKREGVNEGQIDAQMVPESGQEAPSWWQKVPFW